MHKTTLNSEIETQGPSVTPASLEGARCPPSCISVAGPLLLFSFTSGEAGDRDV